MNEHEILKGAFQELNRQLYLSSGHLSDRVRGLNEELSELQRSHQGLSGIRRLLLESEMTQAGVVPCELGLSQDHSCHRPDPSLPPRLLRRDKALLVFVHHHPGENILGDTGIDIDEGMSTTMWACMEDHKRGRGYYPLRRALPVPRPPSGQMFEVGALQKSAIARVIQKGEQFIAIDEGVELVVPGPNFKREFSYPEVYYQHFGIPELPKIQTL